MSSKVPESARSLLSRSLGRQWRGALALVCLVPILTTSNIAHAAEGSGVTVIDSIEVESFDGTPIVSTLMLPAGAGPGDPSPVVLIGHGSNATASRSGPNAPLPSLFLDHGYAVMTWDSRGFNDSGGESQFDSPDFEVKDVQALITYLSGVPEILQDGAGDPRVGMAGGSYGGAIQLLTAAADDRLDAISPRHSWSDPVDGFTPDDVYKQQWRLPGGTSVRFAPEAEAAQQELDTSGVLSEESKTWLRRSDTTVNAGAIQAPTLIFQGTVDTLFPIQHGLANYESIRASGTPVKLVTYCAGHATCPQSYPGGSSGFPDEVPAGTLDVPTQLQLAWFDRYLKNDSSTDVGASFEWQAQNGLYYEAPSFPLPRTRLIKGKPVSASLTGPGGSGGDSYSAGNPASSSQISAGQAVRADVLGPPSSPVALVGTPTVRISGTVTADGGAEPIAFLELVDRDTQTGRAMTVDRQVTPVRLQEGAVDKTIALSSISWRAEPGHVIQLEVSTGSSMYRDYGTGTYGLDLEVTASVPVAPAGSVAHP